ncbi:hypothetical protein OSB04_023460 [Centaurea solstitialis]|uniref:CCT domain-containing protein n=1 Tax=Centaurea solstitialis TaxID=347529 RepID=A0AA38SRR3_9ASTR|nr:hypothetical protein OSB04_023460 [Centaurea solstitialis]
MMLRLTSSTINSVLYILIYSEPTSSLSIASPPHDMSYNTFPEHHLPPTDSVTPPPPLPVSHFDFRSTATYGGGSHSDCINATPVNNVNGLLFQLLSSPFDSDGSTSSSATNARFTFSAGGGDLQGVNMMQHHHRSESPLSNENDIIFESINKTCRYSPKEKQERIERYRIKKNQRNFNKKIKYVCRKTLADSRPRIKGRFARNDEIERTNNEGGGEEGFGEENVDNWMFNFYDPFSSNLIS